MDAITTLLDIIRVRSAVYFSKIMRPPWGMEVDRRPGFWRFHLVLSGSTWVRLPDKSNCVQLNAGDFIIVPRGEAHALSDQEQGPIVSRHHIPGMEPAPEFESRAPRSGDTHLLCGYFRFAQGTPLAILNQLPSLLVVRSSEAMPPYVRELVGIIQQELRNDEATSLVVLNRLTEIMFLSAVRQWLQNAMLPEGALAALGDANLQRALAIIHRSPEKPWTVDELARVAGHSRTAFSNRFRAATGYPPIEYLAHWRIELARRLLAESNLSLDDIASRIGYVDTNAFTRAFSRINGTAPGAYRKASRNQV